MTTMSEDRSGFLHSLRWLAALIVVVGHVWMYHRIAAGRSSEWGVVWDYVGSHAHAAVMVFFVLSGFVVAYTIDSKQAKSAAYGLREYLVDRWSRIYSVLIPAIVLTVLLDAIGGSFFRIYHDPELIPQNYYWLRVFLNAFGLQSSWGFRAQMGSNPALWSIAYELAFYALWGVIHFRNEIAVRAKWLPWAIGIVWFAVFGWKIAFYFLLWLLGVLAWRCVQRTEENPAQWLTRIKISFPWLLLLIFIGNDIVNYRQVFGRSELVNDTVFAILIALILCTDVRTPEFFGARWKAFNRHIADFSYSIYAYHLPIVFFLCGVLATFALVPGTYGLEIAALMGCALLGAYVLYLFTEKKRSGLRQWLLTMSARFER